MKEKFIKVLKVQPQQHPEVFMLENTLKAMQEAVGGLIDIAALDEQVCILSEQGHQGMHLRGADYCHRARS